MRRLLKIVLKGDDPVALGAIREVFRINDFTTSGIEPKPHGGFSPQ